MCFPEERRVTIVGTTNDPQHRQEITASRQPLTPKQQAHLRAEEARIAKEKRRNAAP